MHRHTITALGLLALAVAIPHVCFAPVEVEPNDDPTDESFTGYVTLSAPGTDHVIDGTLTDGDDVDWFELSAADGGDAIVLLEDFTPPASLQTRHEPPLAGDRTASTQGHAFRGIFGWPVLDPAAQRGNYVAVSGSLEETSNAYRLTIIRPGLDAFKATVKAVDKTTAGKDTFKIKLIHAPDVDLDVPTVGAMRVRLRDFVQDLPLEDFKRNGKGTKFTWKGKGPGVTKLSWNVAKGVLSVKAKGFDFATSTADGLLPVVVSSPGGGVGADLTGAVVDKNGTLKVSSKR